MFYHSVEYSFSQFSRDPVHLWNISLYLVTYYCFHSRSVHLFLTGMFLICLYSVILVLSVFLCLLYTSFHIQIRYVLYMQFSSCASFFGLVFVSMLAMTVILMLFILWISFQILWIFSDIPQMYGLAMEPFMASWLATFCLWLLLRILFINFGKHPFSN